MVSLRQLIGNVARRAFAILALAGLIVAQPSAASIVVVWPVDPTLKPGEQATALWLENKGDKPVTLQVRPFDWTQPQGDDSLTPQNEVVVSPPIATVPAGARQLIRIIRRNPMSAAGPEKPYRLLIDEVPTPPMPGDPGTASARLAIQMRYSIPLFVYTADPAAQNATIESRVLATPEGRVVELRNVGTLHARLTDLRIVSGGRDRMIRAGLTGYVLPGATVRLRLPSDAVGSIKLSINGVEQTLEPGA